MKTNRDKFHLERIIEAIDRIIGFVSNSNYNQFVKNEMMFDAKLMQIVNTGEMVNRLSDDFREKHHNLPWHDAIGMRNQIAHGYFEVEKDAVWDTLKNDLPNLRKQINQILS